jgi:hypothetical protein
MCKSKRLGVGAGGRKEIQRLIRVYSLKISATVYTVATAVMVEIP